MRHLIVVLKLLLNRQNREKGVTLLEVVLVSVIVGIMAAISVPNMLEEQRQQRVNEAFNRVRGALVEAQVNANRLSTSCTVRTNSDQVTGSPSGCVLEPFAIDTNIVSIREGSDFASATPAYPSPASPIETTFSFTGTTSNVNTIWIARTDDMTGNTAKCIVISSIGMIRTGIYNSASPSKCENLENKRYTP